MERRGKGRRERLQREGDEESGKNGKKVCCVEGRLFLVRVQSLTCAGLGTTLVLTSYLAESV